MLVALALGLVQCGCPSAPRTLTGSSAGAGSAGSGGSASSGDSTGGGSTGPGPECPYDFQIVCDGKCVNPAGDNDNCGECGHVCKPFQDYPAGNCVAGKCKPTIAGCLGPEDGWASCDEYCASRGQQCVESKNDPDAFRPCAFGGVFGWGEAGQCPDGITFNNNPIGFCADPLPFGENKGGDVIAEVSCCCTQD